jgi:hypothetical protein
VRTAAVWGAARCFKRRGVSPRSASQLSTASHIHQP